MFFLPLRPENFFYTCFYTSFKAFFILSDKLKKFITFNGRQKVTPYPGIYF